MIGIISQMNIGFQSVLMKTYQLSSMFLGSRVFWAQNLLVVSERKLINSN